MLWLISVIWIQIFAISFIHIAFDIILNNEADEFCLNLTVCFLYIYFSIPPSSKFVSSCWHIIHTIYNERWLSQVFYSHSNNNGPTKSTLFNNRIHVPKDPLCVFSICVVVLRNLRKRQGYPLIAGVDNSLWVLLSFIINTRWLMELFLALFSRLCAHGTSYQWSILWHE